MKNKIKILEISKNEHRSLFSFPKEQKLFGIIRNVLLKTIKLNLDSFERDHILGFGFPEDETGHPVLDKEEDIKKYNEQIFNFSNENYSVDIIFFSKKVTIIFNYTEDKQKEISKVFEGVLEE